MRKKLTAEERELWEELYKYRDKVYYIGMSYVHNHHDAEDIVGHTYEKLGRHLHKTVGRTKKEQLAFLYIVANSCANDKYRKNMKYNEQFGSLNELIARDDDLEFLKIEENDCVLRLALEKLSADDRNIILLRHHYGYDMEEIADIFGIKRSTGYQRLRKAKEKLSEIMSGDHFLALTEV